VDGGEKRWKERGVGSLYTPIGAAAPAVR
jgi:hypothetical protein